MSDARVNLSDFGLVPELAGLTQVDDAGLLFISPVIHDWIIVSARGIDTVIDLEGGLDVGVPTVPNQILYIYFPIFDEDLPNLEGNSTLSPRSARHSSGRVTGCCRTAGWGSFRVSGTGRRWWPA